MAEVGSARPTEDLPGRNPVVSDRRLFDTDNIILIVTVGDTCSKKRSDPVASLATPQWLNKPELYTAANRSSAAAIRVRPQEEVQ
jgi:hypothetical protein